MINKKSISFLIIFSLFFNFGASLFADSSTSTTPEPYNQDEFPQALKDFRRFEIITFGAMPFVMLDATLVYSGYKYFNGEDQQFNVLSKSSYTTEETKNIILSSLGISTGIALTDLIVQLVKRSKSKKIANQRNLNSNINILQSNEVNNFLTPEFDFFDESIYGTPEENTQNNLEKQIESVENEDEE